jgi:hypothetical protein
MAGSVGYFGGGLSPAQLKEVIAEGMAAGQSERVNKIIRGIEPVAIPGTEYTLIDYTVPANTQFIFMSAQCASDGDASWHLLIDDVIVNTKRNWLSTHNIDMTFDYTYLVNTGHNIKIKAINNSKFLNNNILETFLFGKEQNI